MAWSLFGSQTILLCRLLCASIGCRRSSQPPTSKVAHTSFSSHTLQYGYSVVAQLCWYKVTCSGDPVCPLDSAHKKPFELAYIARRVEPESRPVADGVTPTVCVCCPPSCHSRKPPLESILPRLSAELGIAGYAAASASWVELFGRECRPGGLIVGNQAVALNRRNAWVVPRCNDK